MAGMDGYQGEQKGDRVGDRGRACAGMRGPGGGGVWWVEYERGGDGTGEGAVGQWWWDNIIPMFISI